MASVITGAEIRTCLGDTTTTFKALVEGVSGVSPLRFHDTAKLNVTHGYQIDDGDVERPRRAAGWLTECVAAAAAQAGLDATTQRVTAIVGTGLRELRSVERFTADGVPVLPEELHFAAAVRAALPGVADVITVSNACSASGHALAIAADLLAADEADAVVVAGCDATTESMLTMIGRVGEEPTTSVRPFDRDRTGVLLGEGAAAVVVQPRGDGPVVLGVGLSCDAYHETAPDVRGIVAAMRDAHERAGITPDDVDLVLAHGTGTSLNDPTEAAALAEVFADVAERPLVTGVKGAIGHTSGAAALTSLVLAVESVRAGWVPPNVGLRTAIDEAADLRLVVDEPASISGPAVVQVDAFGFGGVNAVCVIEVAP
ncbi:beta-ketoacyl synthase N-terminal-like domain-containing protein [Actinosynnema sp. NPDC023658]|uniref:beta-ketoacyl synthase N-terminal-like domain-containing protein n=1 Tax=Actinosynnema sp. NPDC023658 TaxID=3155465 RepID=UPI003401D1AD